MSAEETPRKSLPLYQDGHNGRVFFLLVIKNNKVVSKELQFIYYHDPFLCGNQTEPLTVEVFNIGKCA